MAGAHCELLPGPGETPAPWAPPSPMPLYGCPYIAALHSQSPAQGQSPSYCTHSGLQPNPGEAYHHSRSQLLPWEAFSSPAF